MPYHTLIPKKKTKKQYFDYPPISRHQYNIFKMNINSFSTKLKLIIHNNSNAPLVQNIYSTLIINILEKGEGSNFCNPFSICASRDDITPGNCCKTCATETENIIHNHTLWTFAHTQHTHLVIYYYPASNYKFTFTYNTRCNYLLCVLDSGNLCQKVLGKLNELGLQINPSINYYIRKIRPGLRITHLSNYLFYF